MRHFFLFFLICLTAFFSVAQDPGDTTPPRYLIIKQDGHQIVGELLHQDAREVIVRTDNLGEIIIPKHVIESMRPLEADELDEKGEYAPDEVFSTRYFLTTNGLPVKRGEHYVQWNLFGPDFQFAVTDRLGMGFMTSWLTTPIVGTIKYSIPLGEKRHLALGGLFGNGSWIRPGWFMALPFAALTFGDRRANLNLSAGYGLITSRTRWNYRRTTDGAPLFSVGGMIKAGRSISLVFDSFIMTLDGGMVVVSPGLRWQSGPDAAFQFGMGGVVYDGEAIPTPLPMLQWYRRL